MQNAELVWCACRQKNPQSQSFDLWPMMSAFTSRSLGHVSVVGFTELAFLQWAAVLQLQRVALCRSLLPSFPNTFQETEVIWRTETRFQSVQLQSLALMHQQMNLNSLPLGHRKTHS